VGEDGSSSLPTEAWRDDDVLLQGIIHIELLLQCLFIANPKLSSKDAMNKVKEKQQAWMIIMTHE
jgi:hypothetical protein